jgi:Domain of unknown function (DUF222)
VAVTAQSVEPLPWPAAELPPGVEAHPARLGELMPVAFRTPEEKALELERIARIEGRLAAYKVEVAAAFARDRTDADDRPSGTTGAASPAWAPDQGEDRLPGVSEFFPDELALILNCSRAEATSLAEVALTLVERLPTTWAALADGELDWPRARALARELGWPARETEPEVVAEVEAAVLPRAGELSVTKLRALTRRELLRRDASAAEQRRKQAERASGRATSPCTARPTDWRRCGSSCPPRWRLRPERRSTPTPGWPKRPATGVPSVRCAPECSPTSSSVRGTPHGRRSRLPSRSWCRSPP